MPKITKKGIKSAVSKANKAAGKQNKGLFKELRELPGIIKESRTFNKAVKAAKTTAGKVKVFQAQRAKARK